MEKIKRKIFQNFRKKIFAGLLAAAPIALTYYLLVNTFKFLDKLAGTLLNYFGIQVPGLGFILIVLMVYSLGVLVTTVLGNKLFSVAESIVTKLPIVKTVYSTIKQITYAFSGTGSKTYKNVVWVEYPKRNAWTLAFVTGVSENSENIEFYHLFVPTTPNPTSGFFIMVPKSETVKAEMTVEQGLKAIISGGLLAPTQHHIEFKKD